MAFTTRAVSRVNGDWRGDAFTWDNADDRRSTRRVIVAEPARLQNVLVGVDGTSSGRDAIALADRLRAGEGGLTLAHVVLAQTPIHRNFHSTPAWKNDARQMLERERAGMGVGAKLTGMFASSVGSGLHQLAEDCDADVIVVGSCSRGPIGRVLVGDDARGTVSGAPCPVAVAPHGYAGRSREIRVIGVAYNGSPESESALNAARHLALRHDAVLQALRVVPPTTAVVWPAPGTQPAGTPRGGTFEDFEQEASQRLTSHTGVDGHVTVGLPGDQLLAFGDAVDLLVMGSRGHGPLRRLILGSTSMQLTREARCPLLIVPRPAAANEHGDTP
jgi:nucleotide-binding universal stress UspA family protein